MTEIVASHHFQTSGALAVRSMASPHPKLMRDPLVQFSRSRLVTAVSRHLLPNRRQGDPASRRTDHPSHDRCSLGYLVSLPPLLTDHELRLDRFFGSPALQPQAADDQHMDGWLGATA